MPALVSVRVAVMALAALAAAMTSDVAHADKGVSVSLGRIEIDELLEPGRSYELPVLSVVNPGNEPARYRMAVDYVVGDDLRRPLRNWFRFSVSELSLRPRESRPVEIGLRIPPGAKPGGYQALVGAQLAPAGGGAQVGAAAVARLTFGVAPASYSGAWLRQILDWLDRSAPLPHAAAAALVAWLLARIIRRRLVFSVSRRR